MLRLHDGQLIAGKYRLLEPLAKGGMGSVWIAKHIALNVPVAVKFMDPRYADLDDLRSRFEREAIAAARLRMPNVVQILDYGVEGDTPYIVMEFLRGEDLGARLAREGRLSVHDTVAILVQVCKALRRAHDEGIVHRDLKPANVFLVTQDGELLVKVLDFGIAKVLRCDSSDEVTKTGDVMGSPAYMSPEQVRGSRDIDHRTDLWSLGVIAYRALTGTLPFPGTNSGDIFVKICTDQPVAPTSLAPDLDARIDAFITKALAKDPSRRFSTAKELAEALGELDQSGPARGSFQSMPFGTNVESATNAPVTSNLLSSERKKKKPFVKWAVFVGLSTVLMLVGVVYWISKYPKAAETTLAVPISSGPEIVSAYGAQAPSAEAPPANPSSSTSPVTAAAPPPSIASSSKTPSVPRKTLLAPTAKPSANYSFRKEL